MQIRTKTKKTGSEGMNNRLHRQPESKDLFAGFRYSPIKAAVAKIPLSVGQVNKKPLHLVFCLCSRHQITKRRDLPVESAKGRMRRGARRRNIVESEHIRSRCGANYEITFHRLLTRLTPAEPWGKAQEWCNPAPRLCRCGQPGTEVDPSGKSRGKM